MRVRMEYREEQRGQYTNVYLDKIEPAKPAAASHADTDPQRAALGRPPQRRHHG